MGYYEVRVPLQFPLWSSGEYFSLDTGQYFQSAQQRTPVHGGRDTVSH